MAEIVVIYPRWHNAMTASRSKGRYIPIFAGLKIDIVNKLPMISSIGVIYYVFIV